MDDSLYSLLQQGATLLTASRHLAHALQLDYARQAQQHGLRVWSTPRILPWSTYLRLACQQQREVHPQPPRLLSEQQALALWERIVAASEGGQVLLNPAQAARNAQRSWQRLHQYRLTLKQVAAYPMEEAQAFAGWAQQFIDRTHGKDWLDSARFTDWLYDAGHVPDTDLIVYGFDQITPDMQRLLQRWTEQGTRIHRLEAEPRQAEVQVVAMRDGDTELRAAAQWARAQLEAGRQRIAVVVPDLHARAAQATRCFTDVFAPAQRRIDMAEQAMAFRVVATPPLSEYPLVHHALLMLQLLLGRADVLLVGQLLRSPFLTGYDNEASSRALADWQAREARREYWSCNALEQLATIQHCPQLAACLQAMQLYWREHHQRALPSEWTERFTQLLKRGGWAGGRALNSAEQQVQNKFQSLLAELSALDELLGRVDLATAIATLRDACRAESFAPESVDQAVTLIDVADAAGMQFDVMWVMGLHAGDWPPAPEPDPFLPVELQRGVNMAEASAAQALKLAQYQLQRLVSAAKQVVLSWPQHDDDEELRPSPLLDVFDADHAAANAGATHESPQRRDTSLGAQLFAARPVLESLDDTQAPALSSGAVQGGTRILELQSRCPFRAQAELRLYAEPMPTVSPAVEPTERGTLVHRVLTEVWQQLKDSTGLRAVDLNAYVDQVRQIAARIAQQVLPGDTVYRQRLAALEVELCAQWVMSLLRLELQRAPFRVQRAEQIERYSLAGLDIRIQLDRVDELASGGKLLIDYKTGNSNQINDWLDREPGRPRSPQLPLYALAHREHLCGITFAVLAPGKAEFRGLASANDIAPGIKDYTSLKPNQQLPGIMDWEALLDHWHQVLNQLARDYLSGAAEVKPLKKECQYCHLRSLCRVHELSDAVTTEEEESVDE